MIELDEADSGTHRSVDVGERFSLRLHENPTTGFRWEVQVDGDRVALVDDTFEAAGEARGAAGERLLSFQATRSGPASLLVVKRRSWESGAPIEEFSLHLDVRA